MRILLIVDHFGSGGAQRQIVELARELTRRGHSVEFFIYFPEHDFFRPLVDEYRIVVHEYKKRRGFSVGVVKRLISLMRHRGIDVVLSYLNSANIYAELAGLVTRRPKLIVSERTSYRDDKSFLSATLRRMLHRASDHVVANSVTQAEWLRSKWWLKGRVSCIYNGLDLSRYAPSRSAPRTGREFRLLGIGRIGPEKNTLNVIRGLQLFFEAHGYVPEVSWVGQRDSSPSGQAYCRKVDELLESASEVRRRWRWSGLHRDVPKLMAEHDALIHASFYEGLPNVVCEALAAGMPVIASNVCDHPLLVAEGERGYLFDPHEPTEIALAIGKLAQLDIHGWQTLSRNSRDYAERSLSKEKMASAYERLFADLLCGNADTLVDSK